MLDLHLHVWPHAPGTPTPTRQQLQAYCDAAAAKGISEIAITEHCYRFDRILDEVIPAWERPRTGAMADATEHVLDVEGRADLDTYVSALADAQEAGLPVLVGLEVDYLPGAMEAMARVLDDYPFDVLLGSVHWLDDWLFDAYDNEVFASRWLACDVDEVYRRYVDAVLDLAGSGIVDVLAHVDVIKVAGYRPTSLVDHERRLVDGLAETATVVEFSSAGLHKPPAEPYPRLGLLDALLERGIGVTTASDAHTVERIGADFDLLAAELDARGVTELVSFRRRQRVTLRRDQPSS